MADKLTSDELNEKIMALDGLEKKPYDAFGGKVIPYIGWFWRHVWFDEEDYWFGLMPVYDVGIESNDTPKLGFMENNKWGYDYVYCPATHWEEIKQLLRTALTAQTHDNFKKVDDRIQGLLEKGTERKYKDFPRD